MFFLIMTPKIICRELLPLRVCRTQVKVHHRFRVIDYRIEMNVSGHPALPDCLVDELRLARFMLRRKKPYGKRSLFYKGRTGVDLLRFL